MQITSTVSSLAPSSRKPEYAYRIAIVATAAILLLTLLSV
jgi:hypothetical protein